MSAADHEDEVEKHAKGETDEPGVVIDLVEDCGEVALFGGRVDEAREVGKDGESKGNDSTNVNSTIRTVRIVKTFGIEAGAAENEVIAEHDPRDGSEQGAVTDEPGEDVAAEVVVETPGHDDDANEAGDNRSRAETDAPGGEIREAVGGADHIGGEIGGQGGDGEGDEGKDDNGGRAKFRDEEDGIPDGFAKDDDRCGSHDDADETEEGHGGRQAEQLTCRLLLLRTAITGEVRNVEREGCPESDHGGELGDEHGPELAGSLKLRFLSEKITDVVDFEECPAEEGQPHEKKEGGGPVFQPFDGVDAHDHDGEVEKPEGEETTELDSGDAEEADDAGGVGFEIDPMEGTENLVDGPAADPGLDAEPSTGDKGTGDGGDVGTGGTETGANEDREGDAIFCPAVPVEDHGDENDEVAEEDGEDGLPPTHALLDHARGEHVSGNADGHADPEGGKIPLGPGATILGDGSEVGVGKGAAHDDFF